jgi:hypothetical protein
MALSTMQSASNLYATEADKKRVWAQLKTAAMVGVSIRYSRLKGVAFEELFLYLSHER